MRAFIKKHGRHLLYILLVSISIGCTNDEDSIKVGQTWKYTYGIGNPYDPARIYYKEVIEITGEYVLYIRDKKDTLNERKYWFVVNSECVSNCN